MYENSLKIILTWNIRIVLYILSFSSLIFIKVYCVNACSFVDSLDKNEFLFNLFILSILHIFTREFLYLIFNKPLRKNLTLPRHAFLLSMISWIIIGIVAFLFHYLKYPNFPFISHFKLLSSYVILGAGLLSQLEYTIFETQYKKKVKKVDYVAFEEKISKRVTESFFVLTVAPALSYLIILTRYQGQTLEIERLISELTYILALCVAVALVNASSFGRLLKKDTKHIIESIGDIRKGAYDTHININRADELGEISNALMDMAKKIKKREEQIEELLDSFIRLIASAIDEKSKYTGGHCNRVPELTKMLTLKANESNEGIFKDFKLTTEDEFREIDIAAWLHDCGKVTTPEYVMDKASKLETIYNRIHEIRTRFEVIHRDLTIQALKEKLNRGNQKEIDSWLENEHKKLFEEFKIIANANIFIPKEKINEVINKIKEISQREWFRYFDDRLGLSEPEQLRLNLLIEKKQINENEIYPVKEFLLSDKAMHIIEFEENDRNKLLEKYKKLGFKKDSKLKSFKEEVPDVIYNLGEIYNLTQPYGTITDEERFKMNEHVNITIMMLEKLPFPENLKNVPLYAGAHHETLNGSGYPRNLEAKDIPIPARMIALADIFEALTASDRPYKKSKTLSQSIEILFDGFVQRNHIDKDIFELFLKSGVYKEYANLYLKKEQIDDVDINKYLSINKKGEKDE